MVLKARGLCQQAMLLLKALEKNASLPRPAPGSPWQSLASSYRPLPLHSRGLCVGLRPSLKRTPVIGWRAHLKSRMISSFFFFCLLEQLLQDRGHIRAAAASLCHSHSNPRSETHLQPTLLLMATLDPQPARTHILMDTSWVLNLLSHDRNCRMISFSSLPYRLLQRPYFQIRSRSEMAGRREIWGWGGGDTV